MATTDPLHEFPKLPKPPIPTGGGRACVAPPRTFAAVTANSSKFCYGKASAADSPDKGRLGHNRLLEAQLSFASAAAKPRLSPRFKPIDLTSRQYGMVNGIPTMHFTTAEFDAGVALFRHSLIAKFTVGRPPLSQIREIFKANWLIKGRATVSEIWDGRHVMIILDSDEDATVALTSPIRKVGHAMFRLFRYSPYYNPRKEATTTTKWVKLPGLHPGFFTINYISGIVNVFGHFLDVDERTKACASLRCARVCVEVDVTKTIPKEVQLTLSDGRMFKQIIVVEGNIAFCSHCRVHGHILDQCRKKKVKLDDLAPVAMAVQYNKNSRVSKTGTKEAEGSWEEVSRKKGARAARIKNKDPHENPALVPSAQSDNKSKSEVLEEGLEEIWCGSGRESHKSDEESPEKYLQSMDVLVQGGEQDASGCSRLSGREAVGDVSQSIAPATVNKVLNSDTTVLETVEGLKGRAERMVSKEANSCAWSSLIGPGKEQSQRDSSDSDEWSVSDESQEEERSSVHFGKTLKAFQMIKRREPKKDAIKSQRRLRKDKLEALKRTYIKALERTKVSSC